MELDRWHTEKAEQQHYQVFKVDLAQPAVWSHVGVIIVHVQAPAQDTTFYLRLSRQLPLHMTNRFRPVPRIPSFHVTLLDVIAVILTLRHLSQFFDE